MTEQRGPEGSEEPGLPPGPRVPEPVIRRRRRIHPGLIWLVPFAAALVGVLLVVRALMGSGPTIKITFETAEGLEEGKTEVRYKDVVIGRVTNIDLADDRQFVTATVHLVKDAGSIAVEDSQFWVVRVRADLGGVSGFKTLVTGTYIGVNAGKSGDKERHFKGLEKPPSVTNDQKGRRFVLTAGDLGSLNVGSPVYYRRIPVGSIVSFDLNPDGKGVSMGAFVNQPYDRYVTADARFWNASGVDLKLDATGLKLNTQSLVTLIAGGVSFQPLNPDAGAPAAADGTSFQLFDNQGLAMTPTDEVPVPVRMEFRESTRGLAADANVDFKGIVLGRVTRVELDYDKGTEGFVTIVSADLYPKRLGRSYEKLATNGDTNPAEQQAVFRRLIERGLRAQLQSGNLITGQQFISLDYPEGGRATRDIGEGTPLLIPTQAANLDQLQKRITDIVEKVNQVPFEQIGNRLRDALGDADLLLKRLHGEVAPEAMETLRHAQKTLDAANQSLLAPDAPLQLNLSTTLGEVSRTAHSLRDLSDYLQRHPEALIRGHGDSKGVLNDE